MEAKLNNFILVPTDFSEVCRNAVNFGAQMANSLNYKLFLLHVINKDSKAKLKKENKGVESVLEELKKISAEVKNEYSINCEYTAKEGSIFEVIHEEAAVVGAELVILGVHGKKGMQYLIGSHALRVITKLNSPSIVVQNKEFKGVNKILIPVTDFTESRQSVQWAVHIAKVFDAQIELFQQNQPDPGLNTKIEIMTSQISDAFNKTGVKHNTLKAEKRSHLPKQILEYSEKNNVDLIVIMTEPDIYSPDFNMGPWDEKIMFNEAKIPVMCINPVELGRVYNQYLGLI